MSYVEIRLGASGKRLKVQDKEDLRTIFKRLDRQRRDKKGDARVSDKFLDKVLGSNRARRVVEHKEIIGGGKYARTEGLGWAYGKGGRVVQFRRSKNDNPTPNSKKAQALKLQGRDVYRHTGGGHAVKVFTKSPKGKRVTRFKDVSTGRWVSRNKVYDDNS